RIVLATSDGYERCCQTALRLLATYWPTHPPVDIVAREKCIDERRFAIVRCFRAGLQTRTSWTDAMLWYLERWSCDDRFLFWLDDYGLCAQPNFDKLRTAWEVMESDATVASFHLT